MLLGCCLYVCTYADFVQDPVFRVRKATALNLDKIIKVVGEAGISRLLPAYVRLTKDDVYRVSEPSEERG